MNYPFYTMTAAEYDAVNKIIRGCRLDCWAIIRQGPHQVDYLFDSEERKTMPLRSGITTLMEAVGCKENLLNCNLTPTDMEALLGLARKIDLPEDIILR